MNVRKIISRCMHSLPFALGVSIATFAHAETYSWNASSGLLPDSPGSPWHLQTFSTFGSPTLTPNGLLISTSQHIHEMQYYVQDGISTSSTSTLVIEANLKIVRETPTINARAAAQIAFTIAPFTGTAIGIGSDEVFWLSSSSTRGGTAYVDTDNSPHTYRIEVTSNQPGSPFSVFQDGKLILSGATPYISSGALIANHSPQISFGDMTRYSSGESLWVSFSNSLSPVASVPEPSSITLFLLGGLLFTGMKRSSKYLNV